MGFLPRQKLEKKRGYPKLCFIRGSKEVFHIQGPFLGWLEMLTIEVSHGSSNLFLRDWYSPRGGNCQNCFTF